MFKVQTFKVQTFKVRTFFATGLFQRGLTSKTRPPREGPAEAVQKAKDSLEKATLTDALFGDKVLDVQAKAVKDGLETGPKDGIRSTEEQPDGTPCPSRGRE